jgi:hypothetical protein
MTESKKGLSRRSFFILMAKLGTLFTGLSVVGTGLGIAKGKTVSQLSEADLPLNDQLDRDADNDGIPETTAFEDIELPAEVRVAIDKLVNLTEISIDPEQQEPIDMQKVFFAFMPVISHLIKTRRIQEFIISSPPSVTNSQSFFSFLRSEHGWSANSRIPTTEDQLKLSQTFLAGQPMNSNRSGSGFTDMQIQEFFDTYFLNKDDQNQASQAVLLSWLKDGGTIGMTAATADIPKEGVFPDSLDFRSVLSEFHQQNAPSDSFTYPINNQQLTLSLSYTPDTQAQTLARGYPIPPNQSNLDLYSTVKLDESKRLTLAMNNQAPQVGAIVRLFDQRNHVLSMADASNITLSREKLKQVTGVFLRICLKFLAEK